MAAPNSITYNSVAFEDLGFTMEREALPASPSIEVPHLLPASRDGAVASKSRFGPRTFNILGLVQGSTPALLQSNLDLILKELSTRTDKRLDLPQFSDRFWNAKPVGQPLLNYFGAGRARLAFTLVATDEPFGLSAAAQAESLTIASNPDTESTGTVLGNYFAEPIWELTASATGDATIQLENLTAGTSIAVSTVLLSGHKLRYTVATKKLELDIGGGYASNLSNVADGATWPHLTPGVVNSIKVTGITSATLTAAYNARFF